MRVANESVLTSEERRNTAHYQDSTPTQVQDVGPNTPLESLSLNWSEKQLPERERTKHVHRLHPYLGKFIPQLVEVFIRKYFTSGMTILDPFAGSGTTLVQANESSINSIGCDISAFNILIGKVKTAHYLVDDLKREVLDIVNKTEQLASRDNLVSDQNSFPERFPDTESDYLREWFAPQALRELLIFKSLIPQYEYQDFLRVLLSRSTRSARRTTHFDLDFPKRPVTEPYFCYKHGRMCSPTTNALKFLSRYSKDGLRRIESFSRIQTSATVQFIHGDSRTVSFPSIDGVITSPPYVGLIDYHAQHKYAYELLGLEDNSEKEIGPKINGQSKRAKLKYVENMRDVFCNVVPRIKQDGKLIVVAGDKFNLYPDILNIPHLSHIATLHRHVNRRTGRRSGDFFESIFIYTKT